jgi:hypothetical protein
LKNGKAANENKKEKAIEKMVPLPNEVIARKIAAAINR